MLSRLYIENIALIDRLDMSLSAGFSVLTGETGAGKSIVIDAVNLVLGERADRELIKSGCEKALVEAVFQIDHPVTASKLKALDLELEDGQLLLSRELSLSGRNVCRINGRLASLSLLKSATDLIVDIHGQHEHQSLLHAESHILFLDAFGRSVLQETIEAVAEKYAQWKKLCTSMREGLGTEQERERRIDALTYQLNEIEKSTLKDGEEELLLSERDLLANAERIQSALSDGYECIYGGESASAMRLIKQAVSRMAEISRFGDRYAKLHERLNDAYYTVEDIGIELRDERDVLSFDPFRYQQIEERLDVINKLKRKYGASIAAILDYAQKAQLEIDEIETKRILAEQSESRKKQLEDELYDLSIRLSNKRREIAAELSIKLLGQLVDLGLGKSKFEVDFRPQPSKSEAVFTESGLDEVEFLLSTNPGEPLKPLHKVVSGGEMSRIMLALKSISAEADSVSTLIFDEIDTGISGRIASVVGEKMRSIARNRQVICVTHSPQIAALAEAHFLVEKIEADSKVRTSVTELDEESHILAVARIVSGDEPTEQSIAHARDLVQKAHLAKY